MNERTRDGLALLREPLTLTLVAAIIGVFIYIGTGVWSVAAWVQGVDARLALMETNFERRLSNLEGKVYGTWPHNPKD